MEAQLSSLVVEYCSLVVEYCSYSIELFSYVQLTEQEQRLETRQKKWRQI